MPKRSVRGVVKEEEVEELGDDGVVKVEEVEELGDDLVDADLAPLVDPPPVETAPVEYDADAGEEEEDVDDDENNDDDPYGGYVKDPLSDPHDDGNDYAGDDDPDQAALDAGEEAAAAALEA